MGYETEAWRAPTPKDDEDVIFSEHGRIINNVCHRSFWFMLVKGKYHVALLVKHGGGQERGRRASTENVAGIVGFGAAAEIAARSPHAVRGIKRLADLAEDASAAELLIAESKEQAALIGSPNQIEAITAGRFAEAG